MIIKSKMRYLGFATGTSKKSGNSYLLVKMMDNADIFEFYVPSDKLTLVTDVGQLTQFEEVSCTLEMKSFNNKPQVDLVAVK